MLMSIATISRNRRHSTSSDTAEDRDTKLQQRGLRHLRLLDTFLGDLQGAGRGKGRGGVADQLTVAWLQCGAGAASEQCLELVACTYTTHSPDTFTQHERDVVSMYVIFTLLLCPTYIIQYSEFSST